MCWLISRDRAFDFSYDASRLVVWEPNPYPDLSRPKKEVGAPSKSASGIAEA